MADKVNNLQDMFLNSLRRSKMPVTMFLVKGVKLQGIITWFDNFSVLLRRDGQAQLIYKHAISTIMPSQAIDLGEMEQAFAEQVDKKKPALLQEVFLGAVKTANVTNWERVFQTSDDIKKRASEFTTRLAGTEIQAATKADMTTKLAGEKTYFLPFNRGHDHTGAAGNPNNPDGAATSYLWEQVLQRDDLSGEQKAAILRRWAYDARELEVAQDEGMRDGEPDAAAFLRGFESSLGISGSRRDSQISITMLSGARTTEMNCDVDSPITRPRGSPR